MEASKCPLLSVGDKLIWYLASRCNILRQICWNDLCDCNIYIVTVLFQKYYALLYPFGTASFANFINFVRAFGIIWIAIGLWKGLYLRAISNAMFYLISVPFMWRLSPIAHNKAAAEKGVISAMVELRIIQRILDNRRNFSNASGLNAGLC
jgi:hypothetical protein